MKRTANARFAIKNWDEKPYSEGQDLPKLTRARVTKMPSPSGAKWLNCGSLIVLTAGMINPTRARAAGRVLACAAA